VIILQQAINSMSMWAGLEVLVHLPCSQTTLLSVASRILKKWRISKQLFAGDRLENQAEQQKQPI
jgi:hypothetical protein